MKKASNGYRFYLMLTLTSILLSFAQAGSIQQNVNQIMCSEWYSSGNFDINEITKQKFQQTTSIKFYYQFQLIEINQLEVFFKNLYQKQPIFSLQLSLYLINFYTTLYYFPKKNLLKPQYLPRSFFQIEDFRFVTYGQSNPQFEALNITERAQHELYSDIPFKCDELYNIPKNNDQAICLQINENTNSSIISRFTCSNNECQVLKSKIFNLPYITISDVTSQNLIFSTVPNEVQIAQYATVIDIMTFEILLNSFDLEVKLYSHLYPKLLKSPSLIYIHKESSIDSNSTLFLIKYDWKKGKRSTLADSLTTNYTLYLEILNEDIIVIINYSSGSLICYDYEGNKLSTLNFERGNVQKFNESHLLQSDSDFLKLIRFDSQEKILIVAAYLDLTLTTYLYFYPRVLKNQLIILAYKDLLQTYVIQGDSINLQENTFYMSQYDDESEFIASSANNVPIQVKNGYQMIGSDSIASFDENMNLVKYTPRVKTKDQLKNAYLDIQSQKMFAYYGAALNTIGVVTEYNVVSKNLQTNYYHGMPSTWGDQHGRIFSILSNSDSQKPSFLYYLNNDEEYGVNNTISVVIKNKATKILENINPENVVASYDDQSQIVTIYTIQNNQNGQVMKYQYDLNQNSLIQNTQITNNGNVILIDSEHALIADYETNQVRLENIPKNSILWQADNLPASPKGGYLGYLGYDQNSENLIKAFFVIDSGYYACWGYDIESQSSANINLNDVRDQIKFRLYQSGPNQIFISQSAGGFYIRMNGFSYSDGQIMVDNTNKEEEGGEALRISKFLE